MTPLVIENYNEGGIFHHDNVYNTFLRIMREPHVVMSNLCGWHKKTFRLLRYGETGVSLTNPLDDVCDLVLYEGTFSWRSR